MSSSPPELTVRTPTKDDAAAISALCNAVTRDLYGRSDVDERAVRTWFEMRDLGMFLVEHDGRVVGYADVLRQPEGGRFDIDVRVAPDLRGSGLAERLIAAAEDWARERAMPGAVARGHTAEYDTEIGCVLRTNGYRLVRSSFHMEIELSERLERPEFPDGIVVRTYEPERDETAVYECTEEAFADSWDYQPTPPDVWRERMTAGDRFDPALWWLAEDGSDLAGVCLNFWHWTGDPQAGWVGMLGVRRQWRRRGLALAFLRHSFAEFAARGATRVGLGVDAENPTGAVALYERAGMRVVRRGDTYEKSL